MGLAFGFSTVWIFAVVFKLKADTSAFPNNRSMIPSSIISCDRPNAFASLNAFAIIVLIVSFVVYALSTARFNAQEAAF